MWSSDWGFMVWGGGTVVPLMGPLGLAFVASAMLIIGAVALRRLRPLSPAHPVLLVVGIVLIPLGALAQVTLPHTFSNGTVADADEVNANFDAIFDDNGRFSIDVSGSSVSSERQIEIPLAVTQQLCDDLDGCEMRLAGVFADGATPPNIASTHFQSNPSGSPVPWSARGVLGGSNGIDGDGSFAGVFSLGYCFVRDYSDPGGQPPDDSALGYYLLISQTNPQFTCRLTLID